MPDNKLRIMRIFFDDPLAEGGFQLREISRKAKVAPPSTKRYLKELQSEGLITITKHRMLGYPTYRANRDDERFLKKKRIDNIARIQESGLIDHIDRSCHPNAIIIFGSAGRGEDIKESDIDIYVEATQQEIDTKRFASGLNRKIQLFFRKDFGKMSEELKNNIINGVIMKGYLKVF
ncbi:MAG: nucleotidyltransferase domain-containing protein [Nanoarchaeota archaeon]